MGILEGWAYSVTTNARILAVVFRVCVLLVGLDAGDRQEGDERRGHRSGRT